MNFFSSWGGGDYYPRMMYQFGAGFGSAVGLLAIVLVVLWFWALIDAAKRQFTNKYEKALWVLALLLSPALALLAYVVIIKLAKNNNGILPA